VSRSRPRLLRVTELIPGPASAVRAQTAGLPRRITAAITELPVGTLLTLEQHRSPLDRLPRRLALARLTDRLAGIERRSARLTIVAAALIRDGTVLIGCRDHPAELAGRWEFPGGKCERGETPQAALVREIAEELGARIEVGPELGRQQLPDGAVLILLEARLATGSPEPRALEHRQLSWAGADELRGRCWAGTNDRFVADVTGRL
jgi:8-oxo-dGTP pyrophosphatase MutT (NUDIX family)